MALLDDLLSEVRPGLSQLPDVSLVSALRRSAQKFCRESQVWMGDLEPFPLRAGVQAYELSPTDGAKVEKLLTVTVNGCALTMQLRMRELRAMGAPEGPPTAWAMSEPEDGQQVVFDRTPRVAEAGRVVAIYAVLVPSLDAAEIPDWMAERWHDGIVAGARAEVLAQRGTPHFDAGAAADERFRFSMEAARAKRSQVSGHHALLRAQPRKWV